MARGTRATVALTRSGIEFSIHQYDHDHRAPSYGMEAAAALGLDPGEVFKTLIATVDGSPTVAVLPVDRSLDLKRLASAFDGRRAELVDGAVAERLTGYLVGGISPIAQRRSLPTVLDTSAQARARIYVSGGVRGLDLGLRPLDLITVTAGRFAPIARDAHS